MAREPSYFASVALDQAVCGMGAGVVSTLFMQPLDLLKIRFQVLTEPGIRHSNELVRIYTSLKAIISQDGVRGLYRGLTPNLVGNTSSWGFYFLWYSMIKRRMAEASGGAPLSAPQHLLASASSGVVTAVLTNPIWVVKTRMYTTDPRSPAAYRNVLDGLIRLAREEGIKGYTKGLTLSVIGVSNGAVQFMTYEELKRRRYIAREAKLGPGATPEEIKTLSNTEYILNSGLAKLVAISITYPYQVIRSRLQYQAREANIQPYRSIPDCVVRTFREDGFTGFYKGLTTNAVRILPGTCLTFVVYEQLSRFFSRRAT